MLTAHRLHHPLCGFLAGLHSFGPEASYPTFSAAYDAVTQVPSATIEEFEEELWLSQSRKFIHGCRDISVVDTLNDPSSPSSSSVTRQLIINSRPNLVQTAITVPSIAAPYKPTSSNPPPLSQSHFGGLALTLPLFYLSSPSSPPPRVYIIGAGGCSLPTTLSFFTPHITAIEPSASIVSVANKYFGASDQRFSLLNIDTTAHLSSLLPSSVDILIIDADDGDAPPLSMQTESFYNSVLPLLSPSAILAVNTISTPSSLFSLTSTLSSLLPTHNVAVVTPPPAAEVDERHKLVFLSPGDPIKIDLAQYDGLLDSPESWLEALK